MENKKSADASTHTKLGGAVSVRGKSGFGGVQQEGSGSQQNTGVLPPAPNVSSAAKQKIKPQKNKKIKSEVENINKENKTIEETTVEQSEVEKINKNKETIEEITVEQLEEVLSRKAIIKVKDLNNQQGSYKSYIVKLSSGKKRFPNDTSSTMSLKFINDPLQLIKTEDKFQEINSLVMKAWEEGKTLDEIVTDVIGKRLYRLQKKN